MKTVRRKQKKKVNGKVALGAIGGVVVIGLIAGGGGGSKKDAPAPTDAPAAIVSVTDYVTVAPVTQIPVTVAPATVPPATMIPATAAPATQVPTAGPTEIPTLK